MSERRFKVSPIHECAQRKCHRPATSRVTNLDGLYPVQCCEVHLSWAKRRVAEIEDS